MTVDVAWGDSTACPLCGGPRRRWRNNVSPSLPVVHVAAAPVRDPSGYFALSQSCADCGGPFDLAGLGERGPIVGLEPTWGYGAWFTPGTEVVVAGAIGAFAAPSPSLYDEERHALALSCSMLRAPLHRTHPRLSWSEEASVRVVGYVRVSTDLQADQGYGLDVQRDEIRSWAKSNGHRLVDTFTDEGVSGATDPGQRPAFAKALAMLQAGKVDAIVVPRLDRLARDLILQEQLLAEVRRIGGRLCSTDRTEDQLLDDDPREPSRRLVRQVLGAVNEHERGMIRLRLAAGRAAKRERGGYIGGRPRFGYAAVARELVPVEAEQAIIREMTTKRRAGATFAQIARDLNAAGRGPRTGEWNRKRVRDVLIAAGEAPASEWEARGGSRRVDTASRT